MNLAEEDSYGTVKPDVKLGTQKINVADSNRGNLNEIYATAACSPELSTTMVRTGSEIRPIASAKISDNTQRSDWAAHKELKECPIYNPDDVVINLSGGTGTRTFAREKTHATGTENYNKQNILCINENNIWSSDDKKLAGKHKNYTNETENCAEETRKYDEKLNGAKESGSFASENIMYSNGNKNCTIENTFFIDEYNEIYTNTNCTKDVINSASENKLHSKETKSILADISNLETETLTNNGTESNFSPTCDNMNIWSKGAKTFYRECDRQIPPTIFEELCSDLANIDVSDDKENAHRNFTNLRDDLPDDRFLGMEAIDRACRILYPVHEQNPIITSPGVKIW